MKVDLSDFILSFLNHYIADFDPNASGAFLVLMEMSLGLLGIILNLTVLISIKEKESLTSNTVTVILGNLCLSNLVRFFSTKLKLILLTLYIVNECFLDFFNYFCILPGKIVKSILSDIQSLCNLKL